jgi:putative nucleotidyltransferase with HDIG domain
MNVINVNLFACRSGDILGKDITNESGLILVVANTILNDFIISKLMAWGIQTIWIYLKSTLEDDLDASSNDRKIKLSYIETLLAVKTMFHSLASGKSLDFDSMKHISELFLKNMDNLDYILTYLQELNDYDDYTYSHCVNVAFYAMMIGKWLHMTEDRILDLIQAGLLHDIGKVKIPIDIVNKNSRLSDAEFLIMKQHSFLGYEMIKDAHEINRSIKEAVLMHHERMDGSGYPMAVTGTSIGEYAKIIAIADVYDAMTTDRPYKNKSTPFEAFHMFSTIGRSTFDTTIVNVFLLNITSHLIGIKVRLDNGDEGEVVYIPPHEIGKPIIRVMSSYLDISNNSNPQILCIL